MRKSENAPGKKFRTLSAIPQIVMGALGSYKVKPAMPKPENILVALPMVTGRLVQMTVLGTATALMGELLQDSMPVNFVASRDWQSSLVL